MRAIACLFLVLACGFAGAQTPQPSAGITVGGTPIALPIPAGFAQIPTSLPELLKLGEQITPPGNRLLAHLIAAADLKAFSAAKRSYFNRYFLVQTSRQIEGARSPSRNSPRSAR